MSLEPEEETRVGRSSRAPAGRTPFDRIASLVALAVLIVAATFALWVPLNLMGTFGPAAVLALAVIWLVALSSRLHGLRARVEELEAAKSDAPAHDEHQK